MRRLVILLILLSVAMAQTEVLDTGHSSLSIRIAGSTPEEQVLYVPTTDSRQTVDWPQGLNPETDEEGNKFVMVNGNYDYTFAVTVDASKPAILADDSFPPKADESEYTEDSNYIQASDSETAQLALEVTSNSHSMLEAIRDLGLWVHEYIDYNTSYWGNIYPSTTVLEERKGVCDEYTNLYAAMARSLGIPTRVATGMVRTNSEWQRHAWAESLVSGVWVPVDPTYAEIGLVNAFHVKLYAAPSYLFYQFPQSLEDITVGEIDSKEYDIALSTSAELSKTEVAPRERFELAVTITNTGTSIYIPTYYAQKTIGIELLDDFRKTVIVHPGSTVTTKWSFAAPFGERDEYFIILNGPGYEETFNINVNPALTTEAEHAFEISELRTTPQEDTLAVELLVKNTGNQDVAGVSVMISTTLGTVQKQIDLRAGEEKRVEFSYPLVPGQYDLEARVELGAAKTSSFASVNIAAEEEDALLAPVAQLINDNLSIIYILIVAIVFFAIAMVFFVPTIEGLKQPFQEKEEWAKLVKLREKKEF